ncbi:MAG: hypothetical protein NBV61_00035 [Algoriphagus sp.]|nr:hypothetical protein [Algoriphagus sp.]
MTSRFFTLAAFALIFTLVVSCKEKEEPVPQKTPEELAKAALTGSGTAQWTVAGGGSVTRDGQSVTSTYATYELFLNAGTVKTYSTKNGGELFDANGNWSFVGTNFDKFVFTGTKPAATREISFTQTGTTLRLEFRIPAPGARVDGNASLSGNYTFNLVKK